MLDCKTQRIAIASDHAGYELKGEVINYLQAKGFHIDDLGTHSAESCNYASYAHHLAFEIEDGVYPFGIAICGSGNGISMACNKHQGIRSAICWRKDIAELARQHNDANICALPARFISAQEAFEIIDAFLSTDFEGGRHQVRVDAIALN